MIVCRSILFSAFKTLEDNSNNFYEVTMITPCTTDLEHFIIKCQKSFEVLDPRLRVHKSLTIPAECGMKMGIRK